MFSSSCRCRFYSTDCVRRRQRIIVYTLLTLPFYRQVLSHTDHSSFLLIGHERETTRKDSKHEPYNSYEIIVSSNFLTVNLSFTRLFPPPEIETNILGLRLVFAHQPGYLNSLCHFYFLLRFLLVHHDRRSPE